MGKMKELWQEQKEVMELQQERGDAMEEAHVQHILTSTAELIAQQPSRMAELMELLWKAQ